MVVMGALADAILQKRSTIPALQVEAASGRAAVVAVEAGPRSGGTTTLMADPNAKESKTKAKAGRDSRRLQTRESPLQNTYHGRVPVL
jgi:hypothetical protein